MLLTDPLIFSSYGGTMRVSSSGTITCNALQIYTRSRGPPDEMGIDWFLIGCPDLISDP